MGYGQCICKLMIAKTMWSFQHYVCGCVLIITVVDNVDFTYIQLSNQDYHPWWRSVFRGGSTAIFIYTYGLYYFVKTRLIREHNPGLHRLQFYRVLCFVHGVGIHSLLGFICCLSLHGPWCLEVRVIEALVSRVLQWKKNPFKTLDFCYC